MKNKKAPTPKCSQLLLLIVNHPGPQCTTTTATARRKRESNANAKHRHFARRRGRSDLAPWAPRIAESRRVRLHESSLPGWRLAA